jgi:CRP-like cAMP-binding protein
VPVHDYGEDNEGTRYFTMRYVRGQTLTDLLAKPDHPAGSREFFFRFLTIFVKVLDAVAFAHSRGVIHRDLKPDNIMVGAFGEAYLMDWGIAKVLGRAGGQQASPVDAARTLFMSALGTSQDDVQPVQVKRGEAIGDTDAQGQIIGTFFYMAPEQALAQIDRIDERTDIFLLGGVLYEILTGQPPYVGTNVIDVVRLAQAANIPPPDLVAPDMSPPAGLSAICMKCLARDQDDRYQSAIELKRDIETFLKGGASFPSITFAPGEHLMKEGDPGEAVYILQKGTVQVYQTDKAGRRRGLATLGPGAVVGEAAVFRKSSRTASVVAIDAVTATAVTAKQLEKELGLNSWLGALVKALAERFGTMNDRLTKGADEQNLLRVTNWVLQYLVLYGQPDENGEKRVPWSAVVEAAASSLMKSEAELLPLLEGAGFHVDRQENLLSFRPAR